MVWLCKTKLWLKSKIALYEYRRFIVCIKTDNVYKDIAEDVETRFDTSNYELDRPLVKNKNKKVIGLMKDRLGGKIMIQFVGLRAKTDSYVLGDFIEEKRNYVIKRKLKFENHKNRLEATQLDDKINYLEKNKIDIDSLKKDHDEFIKTIS